MLSRLACRACSVEMLRTALDKCSEPVAAYNACLQKNPRQPERCQVSTEILLTVYLQLGEQFATSVVAVVEWQIELLAQSLVWPSCCCACLIAECKQ
jgi:hypothetical protein